MKKLNILSSVCLLVCAALTPVYAGIPPVRWLPAKPVKITTVNTTLKKATANLARVVIPGYANFLSKKTGRDVLAEKGSLGMNMHQAVKFHELFFPQKAGQLLPPEFNLLPDIEKNTPEYIEDTYLHWERPSGKSRVFLLESALPAYLTEPQGEEIFIPSAEQLEEALAFYREVLSGRGTSKLPFSPKFAGAMSAVSNLSLLGNAQDAPLILYAAKKDFESSNKFVDYFVIRALVALNAKKELKELADYRVEKLERNEQLPAVWRGANEMYKLDIEDGLIAPDSETMPDFMQKGLIMHHPFNYVLLNPSKNVTSQWVDLRAGIQEQFKTALAQEPAGRDVAGHGAVQEEMFTFVPPKPKTSPAITAAPASKKQAVNIYTLLSENDKLLKEALRDAKKKLVDAKPETPVEPAVKPETVVKQQVKAKLKQAQSRRTKPAAKPSGILTSDLRRSAYQVLQEVQAYLDEYGQLPSSRSALGQAISRKLDGTANNKFTQALRDLVEQHAPQQKRTAQRVRQELEAYIAQTGYLPPKTTTLSHYFSFVRRKYGVNNPDVQIIDELMKKYKRLPTATEEQPAAKTDKPKQKPGRKPAVTPAIVRERLEKYVDENNKLPVSTGSLMQTVRKILRNNQGDTTTPDIAAIREIITRYRPNWGKHPVEKPSQRAKKGRSNQELLQELQAYLEEHRELPPSRHKLGQAIYIRLKAANPNDPAIQQIHKLVKEYNTRREDSSPKAIRKELEEYIAKNGKLPPGSSSFRATLYKVRNKNNPNDPDVQAINNLLREYASFERQNPEQVYSALSEYWKNNHILPPDNSSLRRKASYWRAKGDPNDPYVQKITIFLEEKKANKRRTPESVRQELVEYIEETGGLPTFKTRLDRAIHQVLQEADPDDPNVQAIAQLLNETESPNRRRTPKQVYEELEAYWQRHQALPESNSSLRRAIRRIRQTGDRNNPYIQKILERLEGGK